MSQSELTGLISFCEEHPNTQDIAVSQNKCDCLGKASDDVSMIISRKKLLPTIVMGMQGGCLDHIVNNISIFMQSESVLFAPVLFGFMLKAQQRKILDIPINRKILIEVLDKLNQYFMSSTIQTHLLG